jgi:hypothetical protein
MVSIDAERKTAFASIPSWDIVSGRDAIKKKFSFRDFNQVHIHPLVISFELGLVPIGMVIHVSRRFSC